MGKTWDRSLLSSQSRSLSCTYKKLTWGRRGKVFVFRCWGGILVFSCPTCLSSRGLTWPSACSSWGTHIHRPIVAKDKGPAISAQPETTLMGHFCSKALHRAAVGLHCSLTIFPQRNPSPFFSFPQMLVSNKYPIHQTSSQHLFPEKPTCDILELV